jgi:hypothetical protein
MDLKNLLIVFLSIGLIICILISGITVMSNSEINNKLIKTENELKSVNESLQENLTRVIEINLEKNNSEYFLLSYLEGIGKYYNASDLYDEGIIRYDMAIEKYNSGHWSSSSAWFENSMRFFNDAGVKYRETREIFMNSIKNTSIINYQNICQLYVDMMNVSSIAMTYLYEASDFYKESCLFYLDGNYNEAHKSKDNAENKLTYYNDEMIQFNDYQEELKNILIEIG